MPKHKHPGRRVPDPDDAPSLTERRLQSQIAADERWAEGDDRPAATRPGRETFANRFEREVDPAGVLPLEERVRRAAFARKAYYTRLTLMAARARRERRQAKEQATSEAPQPLKENNAQEI